MDICILSMQRVMNYGSLLQAYSLRKILQELGHSVRFIDIESNESERALLTETVGFRESVSIARRNILYRIFNQDNNILYIPGKIIHKKKAQKKLFQFADEVLKLNASDNDLHYDCCVIGSDEVFNCMQNASWGFTSQLFGNVPQADKVITYAASCGFTKAEDVPDKMMDVIRRSLGNVSALSVRDDNTRRFVENCGRDDSCLNLDPVLVGDFSKEIADNQKVMARLPKRYCVVYAYADRINSKDEISAILELCKKENMVPVSIGGSQKWVHRHLDLSPFEVLTVFSHAAFVVTDTFHGTIFSSRYSKRFGILVRGSNRNKLGDLIGRLGIGNHEITDVDRIHDVYECVHDKTEFNRFIASERRKSISYLEENI